MCRVDSVTSDLSTAGKNKKESEDKKATSSARRLQKQALGLVTEITGGASKEKEVLGYRRKKKGTTRNPNCQPEKGRTITGVTDIRKKARKSPVNCVGKKKRAERRNQQGGFGLYSCDSVLSEKRGGDRGRGKI